jgi:serine/threonine-protein kinase
LSIKIGDRVGDYQVISMLGTGGMGAVYQVRHNISERLEALKILLPSCGSNPELAERFMREIRLHASLSHPNIAALHNAFHFDDQLVMVIEYIDGETLTEALRRGPVPQRYAVQLMLQVLSALEFAHSKGVIHRDVKPSNIMFTRDGKVKLMDFGIAFAQRAQTHLTQTGAVLGSMYYMSPEQVRAETVDVRSDIYATGITLFESVTGRLPFLGKNAAEILNAHLHQPPPTAKSISPEIMDELSRILARSLEKDPSRRFQSAGEFAQALLQLLPALPDTSALPTVVMPRASENPPSWAAKTPHTSSQAFAFDPVGLERVRKDLAQHIGPMAKLLVDRAAKRSRSWGELYSLLAPEVPAGKDRDRFLAGCPR